jgi:hypothetical protein
MKKVIAFFYPLLLIGLTSFVFGMYFNEDDRWGLRDSKFELFDVCVPLAFIIISISMHLHNKSMEKQNKKSQNN